MEFLPDSLFRAKQGTADLIASGTIVSLDNQPLEIGIPISNTENLTLRLILKKDEVNKLSRWGMQTFLENPKLLELTIFNLESPLGGGPAEPLSLWRSPDSAIVLALRIFTQPNTAPIIHFSFYKKKLEVKS
jgi:hypothetical protein